MELLILTHASICIVPALEEGAVDGGNVWGSSDTRYPVSGPPSVLHPAVIMTSSEDDLIKRFNALRAPLSNPEDSGPSTTRRSGFPDTHTAAQDALKEDKELAAIAEGRPNTYGIYYPSKRPAGSSPEGEDQYSDLGDGDEEVCHYSSEYGYN
jgi:hypothetical protein